MKELKPVPLTPPILRVVVWLVIIYGLLSAVLELWNLNIIPGRLEPGLWVSLAAFLFWVGFLRLDRRAQGKLKQQLFTAATVIIVGLLAVYASLDRASTTARLASLAMNWSLAGFGLALFFRIRRGGEEKVS